MRNNFLNLVAYDPIAEPCAAKMPQNTGGGASRTKNRSVTVSLSSDTTTNREMTERRPREDRETFVLGSSLLETLKYVACMLLALVLGIGQMWGDPTIPSTTLTLPATGLGSWTGVDYTNISYNDATNGYVIYTPYAIRMSKTTQTWYAVAGTTGSATGTWSATDIFKGNAYYSIYQAGETDASKYRMDVFKKDKKDIYHYYRVTNCTGVKLFYKSSASFSISLKVYEVTGEPGSLTATEVTAAANSASHTKAEAATLANNSSLSASKNYIIEVHGEEGNKANAPFYEIAFYYPLYTVTYDLNGGDGTTPTQASKTYGATFDLHDGTTGITPPTGQAFLKWKDQDNDEYDGGDEYTMPAKNVTLTAQWGTPAATYDISFVSDHGTAPSATTASKVTLAELSADGWAHTGWVADQNVTVDEATVTAGTKIANGKTAHLSANTEFTAQWSQLYEIAKGTLTNGDITTDLAEAVAGATVTLTATPDEDYVFSAWDVYKTGESSTKVAVTDNTFTMPAYAVTVNATFAADARTKVLYVTANSADATKANDKLYAALKDTYNVKIVGPTSDVDQSGYALVVLHESIGGGSYSATAVAAAKAGDVPVLNTKSYFYNSDRWGWGTPNAGQSVKGATLNSAYCNIASHPLFDGLTVTDGFFEITDDAAAKCMQPIGEFTSGKEGYTLATTPNNGGGNGCAIHELTPAQRGASAGKYLMISVSNSKLDALNANGQKLFQNAAAYLIGSSEWSPVLAPATEGIVASLAASYSEGDNISLSITATNVDAATTYTWYKGATLAAAEEAGAIQAAKTIAENGNVYAKASCLAEDAGTYWCVITKSAGCELSASLDVTVLTCTKPGTPANLTATDIAYTTATLGWDAAENANGYKISIVKKSDESVVLDWTTCATNSYAAADLAQGTEYTFKVKAVGATGYCEYGLEASKDFTTTAPSVADLVTIADDWTFTPSAAIAGGTLAESGKLFSVGDGNDFSDGGIKIKENRALAFKVAANAKVKVTFKTNGTREMQLGTATSDDDNKAYGHSATSPATFDVIPAAGVVYLTASSELFLTKLEITYPHSVTYALNGGEGKLPTESAHYVGDEFTLHNGVTDITAPAGKEFAGWNDGTTTYDGGTEYTMGASAVTLTAQWVNEVTKYAVTYDLGDYTEGVAPTETPKAENAVFALKAAPARPGYAFKGWKCNIDEVTYNAGVDYTMTAAPTTFTAQWKAVIQLIEYDGENYSINTDKFTVYEGTELQNEEYTVDGKNFAKNFKFANTCSSTPFAGQAWANKFMAYDVASNSTDIKLYVYNKNNSNKKLYYQIVPEGSAAAAFQSVTITSKATNQVVSIPTITAAKGARVLFGIESTDVRICQIEVTEDGTALPAFGTNGYEFSVPGRAATYNKVGAFDGFEFKTNADLKFISGQDYIALRNIDGSQYVKFTVATNIQLQVTTPNANKFYVSKTAAGDAEKDTKYGGSAATHNVNLHAGTYYIAPVAGSSDGEVRITKLAFATAPGVKTVTFNSDEGSSVEAQEVFAGEKAVEPTTPSKSGYRFVEWQLSGSAYDFDEAVTADITLDAVWQKTWNVTFDADNGSDPIVVVVDNNQAVAQPANPEKSGFDFVEWQLSGSAYDFATLVTEDITLKATWEVAQDDATLSALSYNGNAIDVASAEDISGVQTYTYHLPWGSTVDPALISVTPTASTATKSSITYNNEEKLATFQVISGNGLVSINYAIQFVIDAKRGTSLIKATTNNVVTGLIGGTIDQSYSGNANSRKLNKTNYFGVTLANDETFQEGDVFIVNIATAADLGKFMVFADKDRTELVADQGIVYTKPDVADPVICPTGEMMLVLPAAANGKKSLYLSRENVDNSEQWNVTFSYIEVTREKNPAIKSFKFGDDAATINESAKTISIDVPYGTAVTALTPTLEAYGNNGATYTPAGATDFTTSVNYVVTDAYGELSTTYAVTVNVAAPSENAYLASLSVTGYALDFNKETTTYNVVLDYGTTVLPEITYAVEDVGLATAVKVENGVNGATTITVTPQAGAGYEKVYTVNFSVSTTPKFVIYDGSTMTNIPAATGSDVTTGFSWSMASGIGLTGDNVAGTWQGKNYAHAIKGFKPNDNTSNIVSFVIPENYLAKVRLVGSTNSDTKERSMFIAKAASRDVADAFENYVVTSSTYVAQGIITNLMLPGTYYLGSTDACRLFELSVQLYPIDYSRPVTEGRFGTICLPNGGVMVGAELYEVAYKDPSLHKIFFDQIVSGEMIAGRPYIFLPKEGTSQLAVFYTDASNAEAGNYHGLYGSYTEEPIADGVGNYILLNNQYREVQTGGVAYVTPNRAYFKYDEIPGSAMAPMPGRKRMSIGAAAPAVTTGMDELNASETPVKVMIDGQLFIIRGEKMYNANGQLVK